MWKHHEVLGTTITSWKCPDCDYETYHIDGTEERCIGRSEIGSRHTNGTVGAPGPLMNASGWTDPHQVVVCTIPDPGLNTFQGLLRDTLSQSRGEQVGEFTLMASFDFLTYQRLAAALYGDRGSAAMDDAKCSLTIVIEELPTT